MALAHNPQIVKSGLVLCLDAANTKSYPGTGTTWYDISGNGNHFTLYNGVLFDNEGLYSDGVDAYGRSANTLDLSGTSTITVISVFKDVTTSSGFMVYEHTDNWNTTNSGYGGFGFSTNSNGGSAGSVPYGSHIQLKGNVGYSGTNVINLGILNYQHYSVIHDFTQSANNETNLYYNGALYSDSPYPSNNTGNFGNDYMYLFKRGSGSVGSQGRLAVLKIYNRALTANEIYQNYIALRGRYGV